MNKGLGFLLILAAIGIGWAYVAYFQPSASRSPDPDAAASFETVRIRYGSEKKGLLNDPEVIEILRQDLGIGVDGTKMGSIEMSEGSIEGVDALWPSSDLAALLFQERHPRTVFKKHNVFSTPIVFYSWPKVVDALMAAGVASRGDGNGYRIDLAGLLSMMRGGRSWKSLGLSHQTGPVTVRSTDPRKSNSGYLLSGLIAIMLNGGRMADLEAIGGLLPTLVGIFKSMGYMENSSGILFDNYIKQGQGAYPLIANYESLALEFYQAHPDHREQIRRMVRVLIPEPTVWSDHPIIALTPGGEQLLKGLQDERIQKIARERFGFRTGMTGSEKDREMFQALGLPETIEAATPLPAPRVMERILSALE